jgi:hypothetical protein
MQYNLSNNLDKERFLKRTEHALANECVVEFTEKVHRSPNQNRYLHLLIGVVAMEVGEKLEYVKEMYYKRLVNAPYYCIEKQDKYVGKTQDLRSSAELTKEEMTETIDRFRRWGHENGIYMPSAEDEQRLRDIEIEMGRLKHYL